MSWRVYIVVTWNSARAPRTCSRLVVCDARPSYHLRAKPFVIVVFVICRETAGRQPAFCQRVIARSSIANTQTRHNHHSICFGIFGRSVGWFIYDFGCYQRTSRAHSERKINFIYLNARAITCPLLELMWFWTFKLFVFFFSAEIKKTKFLCFKRTLRKSCSWAWNIILIRVDCYCDCECKISVNYSDSCKIQCCILWCVSESRI